MKRLFPRDIEALSFRFSTAVTPDEHSQVLSVAHALHWAVTAEGMLATSGVLASLEQLLTLPMPTWMEGSKPVPVAEEVQRDALICLLAPEHRSAQRLE